MPVKCIKIFSVLLVLINLTSADDWYTASFLDLGVGARQAAMGGAGGLLTGDASAFYWNPAGIGFVKKRNVQFMHNWLFEGMAMHDYLGGAYPLFGGAVVGLNGIRLGMEVPIFGEIPDGVDVRDYIVNYKPGSLSYYDLAIFFTFSKMVKKTIDLGWQYFILPMEISWGVNMKYITQKMGEFGSAQGIGFDAGTLFKIDAAKLISEELGLGTLLTGLALRDIANSSIEWTSDEGKRPSDIRYDVKLSLGYEHTLDFIRSRFLVAYDYNTKYNDKNFGLEYRYADFAALRFGWDKGAFTTGAGVTQWGISIDYAFSLEDLGNAHRVSGGYTF